MLFYRLLLFSESIFSKNSFRNTIRVSNSLNPDQAQHFVGPVLGSNFLQLLSADDTSRQRVDSLLTHGWSFQDYSWIQCLEGGTPLEMFNEGEFSHSLFSGYYLSKIYKKYCKILKYEILNWNRAETVVIWSGSTLFESIQYPFKGCWSDCIGWSVPLTFTCNKSRLSSL